MSKYPEVVQQLVSAAFDQGMSKQTLSLRALRMEVMGARVALQAQFPTLTFILDRPHLKQHLYLKVAGEVESAITLYSPKTLKDSRSDMASRYH